MLRRPSVIRRRRAANDASRAGGRPASPRREEFLEFDGRFHADETQKQDLELDTRLRGAVEHAGGLELAERGEHPQQVRRDQGLGGGEETLARLGQEFDRLGLRIEPQHQEGSQRIAESAQKLRGVVPVVEKVLDEGEHPGPVPVRRDLEERQISIFVDEPEHAADVRDLDRVSPEGEHLVEGRERVPDAAFGTARDRPQRPRLGGDSLRLEHGLQPARDVRHGNPPEVESLAAGHDGRRAALDLLRLGGGEGEDHARRRLLEDLQERVPRVAREHVRFVEDVDLVALLARGRVRGPAAEIPRVLDAPVARRIDFHDVERGASGPDPLARRTRAARFAGGAVGAIQGHREDARRRRLPDPARAAEEIRVTDPPGLDGGLQRGPDVVLSDQLREASGPVGSGQRGAVQGLVSHLGRPGSRPRPASTPSGLRAPASRDARTPPTSGERPQAGRGDRHTLTAATFTVLTGFTRSGPTGLGHRYLTCIVGVMHRRRRRRPGCAGPGISRGDRPPPQQCRSGLPGRRRDAG